MSEPAETVTICTLEDVSEADLAALLDQAGAEIPSFSIWERLDQVRFPRVEEPVYTLAAFNTLEPEKQDQTKAEPAKPPLILNCWERGWLFNRQLELRWERDETGFRVFITSEAGQPAWLPAGGQVEIYTWTSKYHSIFLWGDADPRIGRKMEYEAMPEAVDANNSPQTLVKSYHDPYSHKLRYYRYVLLKREREKVELS